MSLAQGTSCYGGELAESDSNGYMTMTDSQFRESLDSLLQTFESQPSSLYMDVDVSTKMTTNNQNSQPQSFPMPSDCFNQYNTMGLPNMNTVGEQVVGASTVPYMFQPQILNSTQQIHQQFGGNLSMMNLTSTSNSTSFGGMGQQLVATPVMLPSIPCQVPGVYLTIPNPNSANTGVSGFVGHPLMSPGTSNLSNITNNNMQLSATYALPAPFPSSTSIQASDISVSSKPSITSDQRYSNKSQRKEQRRGLQTIENNPRKRSWHESVVCQDENEISEDEDDHHRRRQDRNVREQMRSHQITSLINVLRDQLQASNVEFKPDKFSTLMAVDSYIRHLQEKSTLLDQEHKKLLDTITQTSEIVNYQYVPTPQEQDALAPIIFDPDDPLLETSSSSPSDQVNLSSNPVHQEEDSRGFVKGIDYKFVFECCPFACCISSIDGRFMDCNKEFEEMTGYTRSELLPNEAFTNPKQQQEEKKAEACTKKEENLIPYSAWSCSDEDMRFMTSNNRTCCTIKQDTGDDICRPPSPGTLVDVSKKMESRNKSLFNVLHRDHIERLFCAMSEMLRFRDDYVMDDNSSENDSWADIVKLCRGQDVKVKLRVSLVRSTNGLPRFFNCVMHPVQ